MANLIGSAKKTCVLYRDCGSIYIEQNVDLPMIASSLSVHTEHGIRDSSFNYWVNVWFSVTLCSFSDPLRSYINDNN